MASLVFSPSSFSSALVSRYSWSSGCFVYNESRLRISPQNGVRCDLVEPLKYCNGKPSIPVHNGQAVPNFLSSRHPDSIINKSDTRLRIFSGTANPSLSQVNNLVSFSGNAN
ncbi:ribose-phosphate pyrophosphokinase 2, chloroplastic-like [Macadamia integrifolia]|uniref:ribose-phosphate pyrophosphokinase 2, chloroplastic-like n=1 Tax=Macadamia integrifolia TaxID=60698 RepID=UPI001C5310CC|nr:ribose-phosphate pyrophosphokinase 2, chloroplastic-like [Macadamia integrifolia]